MPFTPLVKIKQSLPFYKLKLSRPISHYDFHLSTWYQMNTLEQDSFGRFTMIKQEKVGITTLSLAGQLYSLIWCLKFIDILTNETNYKLTFTGHVILTFWVIFQFWTSQFFAFELYLLLYASRLLITARSLSCLQVLQTSVPFNKQIFTMFLNLVC